jgi:diaminopimelate decarboxylase
VIADADPRALVAAGQTRASDGTLEIGGVRVDAIAREFGTPALVFDAGTFESTLDYFSRACEPHGIMLAYAAKALLIAALAKRLARREKMHLDVCSAGEILTAERGGFPAARMYLHGCGKSVEELDAAIEGRVALIVVDGLDELRALAIRAQGRPVAIGLRINTGIEAHTHEFVRTGGENTKFGIAPKDVPRALEIVAEHENVRLRVLHAHIGSQIFDEAPYAANLDALFDVAAVAQRGGHAIEKVILGGGFGVDEDVASPENIQVDAVLADLARRAGERAGASRIPLPALGIEPGRALIASAGTSLYTVAAIKDSGTRRFVVVDGGVADNPRPALYGAFHQPLVARSSAKGRLRAVTVAGRSCENDEMVDAELPDDLAVGDLVVLCTTGAYTYTMASNYNRFPRPPIVEVEDGRHRLCARRERLEDVMRNDVL